MYPEQFPLSFGTEDVMDKKVSVIVPSYNVEKYLEFSIGSLTAQTYSNLQIIIIDDGSKDDTGRLADRLAREDDRIEVYHQPNGGLSAARNSGLARVKGDYIAFVDPDDNVALDFVEKLVSHLERAEADIAVCPFVRVKTHEEVGVTDEADVEEEIMTGIEALGRIFSEYNVETIVAWNKLYRSELWDGLTFPVGRIHEDEMMVPQLLYRAKRVVRINCPLYYYFSNDNGIMSRARGEKGLDILVAIEERRKFFLSHGLKELYDKDTYKYLCKILVNYHNLGKLGNMKSKRAELRHKYRETLHDCNKSDWSLKRRAGMSLFAVIPEAYTPLRRMF